MTINSFDDGEQSSDRWRRRNHRRQGAAVLDGAVLKGADLRNTDLRHVSLTGADFVDANLDGVVVDDENWISNSGAVIDAEQWNVVQERDAADMPIFRLRRSTWNSVEC